MDVKVSEIWNAVYKQWEVLTHQRIYGFDFQQSDNKCGHVCVHLDTACGHTCVIQTIRLAHTHTHTHTHTQRYRAPVLCAHLFLSVAPFHQPILPKHKRENIPNAENPIAAAVLYTFWDVSLFCLRILFNCQLVYWRKLAKKNYTWVGFQLSPIRKFASPPLEAIVTSAQGSKTFADSRTHTHTYTHTRTIVQSWALEVFFFNNKKLFFYIFYQVNSLFLHQSYFKKHTPSQINLIKNAKNHFLWLKKLKNTSSAQLCNCVRLLLRGGVYKLYIHVYSSTSGHVISERIFTVDSLRINFLTRNAIPDWQWIPRQPPKVSSSPPRMYFSFLYKYMYRPILLHVYLHFGRIIYGHFSCPVVTLDMYKHSRLQHSVPSKLCDFPAGYINLLKLKLDLRVCIFVS